MAKDLGFERPERILIVDDYALTRDMVRSILRQAGFMQIMCAEDGAAALELLKTERFSLIICDWNMPRVSGLAVLRALRGQEENKTVPFLMLTAEAYKENVVEALKAGVSEYMVKPFTAQTLSDKVERLLK